MYLRNDYLNRELFVTPHARDRWQERGGGSFESLAARLRKALPFGAQVGYGPVLLEHDGLVFAVSLDKTVTTVMTKEQATANVQAICKPHSPQAMRYINRKRKRHEKRRTDEE